jgi:hypothetical protein
MSKKLEKYREVSTQLNSVLKELETRMFVENIVDTNEKKMKVEQSKVVVELK